jgi:prophage maintenance system killer protein
METFLILNGAEIVAAVVEQEQLMLNLAAGQMTREHLLNGLRSISKQLVERAAG